MKVKDIMTRDVITVQRDTTVEAIARLMTKHRISGVPVVDDNRCVVGIVTETDLFLKENGIPFSAVKLPALFKQWVDPARLAEVYAAARHHRAADVMTTDVVCVDEEAEIGQVALLMCRGDHRRVPVVRDGVLVGIVTCADLVRMLAREDAATETLNGTVCK